MAQRERTLRVLNLKQPHGWEARQCSNGRIYYASHHTQTCHWLPPPDSWDKANGLPYGWEKAVDSTGTPYYINHMTKTTTTEAPPRDTEFVEPPRPRKVELQRDQGLGFGFVAGSEKPVIVRFVTEGGPSVGKLLPGDEIIKINEEDVKNSPREYVIDLVRSCKEEICLTVCQPYSAETNHKSALLTVAKKARLKSHPSRVRFAESVEFNGDTVMTVPTSESYIPFMPNVLKVFLENGQTKSFKYNDKTVVGDVTFSLQEKLEFKSIEHFALVLQNTQNSNCFSKMTILQEHELLSEIAARPEAHLYKCFFRLAFVPRDSYDLLRKDPIAFEYFYWQCCNDVVQERFSSELKYDTALRLAALQIQQHSITSNMSKMSLKTIEKECGLKTFVSKTMLDSMKSKDLRKMISHYIKVNQNLAPGQKQLTELQTQLHYMKIVSDIKSFGGKYFLITLVQPAVEAMILVGPRHGISLVPLTQMKGNSVTPICDFSAIDNVVISDDETMQKIEINVLDHIMQPHMSCFLMMKSDVHDFVSLVEGYCRLFLDTADQNIIIIKTDQKPKRVESEDSDTVPYLSKHTVTPSSWSYVDDATENNQVVDLTSGPPSYAELDDTISSSSEQTKINDLHLGISEDQIRDISGAIVSGVGPAAPSVEDVSLETDGEVVGEDASESMQPSSSHDGTIDIKDSVAEARTCVEINHIEQSLTSVEEMEAENNYEVGGELADADFDMDGSSSKLSRKVSKVDELEGLTQGSISLDEITQTLQVSQSLQSADSASMSDTDSEALSGSSADMEKKPLLSNSDDNIYVDFLKEEGPVTSHMLSESDDTDSYSTPTDSPAKMRLESVNLGPPDLHVNKQDAERPTSLMKQPDVPMSEQEYKKIAASFGLRSPDQLELLDLNNQAKLLSVGGVELDPDIIDLTFIPPPKTPDIEQMGEILTIDEPPDGFSDDVHVSPPISLTIHESDLINFKSNSKQECEERESETDSGNETISSENVELLAGLSDVNGHVELSLPRQIYDFTDENVPVVDQIGLDTDIDALIAQLTVPPPPVDSLLVPTKPPRRRKGKIEPSNFGYPISQSNDTVDSGKSCVADNDESDTGTLGRKIKGKRLCDKERRLTGPVVTSNVVLALRDIGPGSSLYQGLNNLAQSSNCNQTEKVFAFDDVAVSEYISCDSTIGLSASSDHSTSKPNKISQPEGESPLAPIRSIVTQSTVNNVNIKEKFKVDDKLLLVVDSEDSTRSKVRRTQSVDRMRLLVPEQDRDRSKSADQVWPTVGSVSLTTNSSVFPKEDLVQRSSTLESLRRRSAQIQLKYSNNKSGEHRHSRSSSLERTWPSRIGRHDKNMASSVASLDSSSSSTSSDERYSTGKLSFNLSGSVAVRDPRIELLAKHHRSASADMAGPPLHRSMPLIRQALHPLGQLSRDLSPRRNQCSSGKLSSSNYDCDSDCYERFASSLQPIASSLSSSDTTTAADMLEKPRSSSLDLGKDNFHDRGDSAARDVLPKIQAWVNLPPRPAVQKLLHCKYPGPSGSECVSSDLQDLIDELTQTMNELPDTNFSRRYHEYKFYKDSLVYETRQFVTDSKLLVSSTTHSSDKLTEQINNSIQTLGKVVNYTYITMSVMMSTNNAILLGECVHSVCNAYRDTVSASDEAVGKPMTDPNMKYLMKQATTLAGLLSKLMKTLKGLSDIDTESES